MVRLKSQPGLGPEEYNRAFEKSSGGGKSVAVGVIVGVFVAVAVGEGSLVGVRVGLGGRIVGAEVSVAVGFPSDRFEQPDRTGKINRKDRSIELVMFDLQFMVEVSPK